MKQILLFITFFSTLLFADIWSDTKDKVKNEYDRIEDKVKIEYDRIEEQVKNESQRVEDKFKDDEILSLGDSKEKIKAKFQDLESNFKNIRDEFKDIVSSKTLYEFCNKNSISKDNCNNYIDKTRDLFVNSLLANVGLIDYSSSIFSIFDDSLSLESLSDSLVKYAKRELSTNIEVNKAYDEIILSKKDIILDKKWKLISNPFMEKVKLDNIFQGTFEENGIEGIYVYNIDSWGICLKNLECSAYAEPLSGIWILSKGNNQILKFKVQK